MYKITTENSSAGKAWTNRNEKNSRLISNHKREQYIIQKSEETNKIKGKITIQKCEIGMKGKKNTKREKVKSRRK